MGFLDTWRHGNYTGGGEGGGLLIFRGVLASVGLNERC